MNLLYKEVTALNRETHKNLKLRQSSDCSFARHIHLIPVAGLEFFQISRHYPIVFIGENDSLLPVALLGLAQNSNSFIDKSDHWEENVYIPAFIRRYPFVFAGNNTDDAPADKQSESFTVCFDAAHTGWNEQEGRALFDSEGKNSEFLDEMIQFLQNFSNEMQRTRQFVNKLAELELLKTHAIQLKHTSGETFTLYDFKIIDEERFHKLNNEQVLDLHQYGYLGLIYAHLISQGNISQLFSRYLLAKNSNTDTETTVQATAETTAADKAEVNDPLATASVDKNKKPAKRK